eukprot:superscaffoldBa00000004_g93
MYPKLLPYCGSFQRVGYLVERPAGPGIPEVIRILDHDDDNNLPIYISSDEEEEDEVVVGIVGAGGGEDVPPFSSDEEDEVEEDDQQSESVDDCTRLRRPSEHNSQEDEDRPNPTCTEEVFTTCFFCAVGAVEAGTIPLIRCIQQRQLFFHSLQDYKRLRGRLIIQGFFIDKKDMFTPDQIRRMDDHWTNWKAVAACASVD